MLSYISYNYMSASELRIPSIVQVTVGIITLQTGGGLPGSSIPPFRPYFMFNSAFRQAFSLQFRFRLWIFMTNTIPPKYYSTDVKWVNFTSEMVKNLKISTWLEKSLKISHLRWLNMHSAMENVVIPLPRQSLDSEFGQYFCQNSSIPPFRYGKCSAIPESR